MLTYNARRAARAVLLAALLSVGSASAARADFGIDLATGGLTTSSGLLSRQARGWPGSAST